MTSDKSWSNKPREISALERPDHVFLEESDKCFYFGDYSPRQGFNHSATNQFVFNLKQPLKFRDSSSWKYKERCIRTGGQLLAQALNKEAADHIVIVPIPPSKPPEHPEYDDRMVRMARHAIPFQTAEILVTNSARDPAHHRDGGRSIESVYATLDCRDGLYSGQAYCIILDDVLTTGSSFKACRRKMLELNPALEVIGFFVARCVWPKFSFDAVDLNI